MFINRYVDRLTEELESEGIEVPKQSYEDFSYRQSNEVIDYMERQLGIKYSSEQKEIMRHCGSSVILACAGSGKALVNGTKVLTNKGFVPIEKISVGDTVYNHYGLEQRVVGVFPQNLDHTIYKVSLNNGLDILCTEDHLWRVKYSGSWSVVNTETMYNNMSDSARVSYELPSIGFHRDYERAYCKSYVDNAMKYLPDLKEFVRNVADYNMDYDGIPWKEDMREIVCVKHMEKFYETACKIRNDIEACERVGNYYQDYSIFLEWRRLCLCYIENSLKNKKAQEDIEKACRVFGVTSKYRIKSSGEIRKERLKIVNIQMIDGCMPSTCIKVDNEEGVFIAEDYIPTHNTTINTHLIAKRIQTREIQDTDKLIYATYNRAGMEEMQQRMSDILKRLGIRNTVKVRTIHSFFLSLIREFGIDAEILSEYDKYRMIGEACKYAGYTPKEDEKTNILNVLSYQINNLVTSAKAMAFSGGNLKDLELWQYDSIISYYANEKSKRNKMDYDDMQSFLYLWLCRWCDSENESEREISRQVREYCKISYNDFYIDEAQDVSKMQFEILRAMMTDPNDKNRLTARLTFIGDDDQCIYEWRGSSPSIIQSAGTEFNIKNFVLSSNYRCKSEIVNYATRGIVQNNMRFEKGMKSNDLGGDVKIAIGGDSYCDFVKSSIIALNHITYLVESGKKQRDIAVLARNNGHLTVLSILLLWSGIYSDTTEETKVTNSQIYKDIKMILKLCDDCWDCNLLWKNIWKFYRYTPRNLASMMSSIQNGCGCTIKDTLHILLDNFGLDTGEKPEASKNLGPLELKYLKEIRYRSNSELKEVLFKMYEIMCKDNKSLRFKMLSDMFISGQREICKTLDKFREIQGVFKLLNDIAMYKTDFDGLNEFLLMLERYEKGSVGVMGDKITLSTIHSAKGREWKNVIMFACDNVGQPNLESLRNLTYNSSELNEQDINAYIDEERRVFYVGNTRAKDNLLVITANTPSVFLLESLGAEVGNKKIIYFSEFRNAVFAENIDLIKNKIKNPESPYYYDEEKYKPNK